VWYRPLVNKYLTHLTLARLPALLTLHHLNESKQSKRNATKVKRKQEKRNKSKKSKRKQENVKRKQEKQNESKKSETKAICETKARKAKRKQEK
jgi:hypothetical protein